MAVVAISDSNNRAEDFEGTPSFTSIGGGAGAGKETVTFFQGAASGSRKVVASGGAGFWVTAAATTDMTSGDNGVWLCKVLLYDSADLNSTGFRVRLGGDQSNYYEFYLADDGTQGDIDYPPKGGWLIRPINPNVTAWRDASTGSPALTAVDEFAVTAAVATGAAKSENIFMDSIDMGDGLYLVGGDSTDPDGTWQDYADDDEGTQTAGRFGHVGQIEGIFFVYGKLIMGRTSAGTVTATVFNDANRTLVFPGGRVAAGWNEIEVDLGNATTDVDFVDTVFVGRGRTNLAWYFDTISDVDAVNEELDITGHGFSTGDAVLYAKGGGSDAIGLTDATEYFVEVMTVDAIALHTTRQNAYTAATPVNLSAGSTGERHLLTRQPDTRPDLTVTGTTGVGFDATGCSFIGFRTITLTSKGTLTTCKLLGGASLDLNGGAIDGCEISGATTNHGVAYLVASSLANIDNSTFTSSGRGHAIEIDTTGTYTLTGCTFTGYGGARAQFLTSASGIDGSTEVITTTAAHGFATGDPVYYNDEGGAASVGLTDGALYYVRNLSSTTLSLHLTPSAASADVRRVNLTASGAETHSLYSGDAAIYNSSGGLVTINVDSGTTPTIRNGVGASTTVNNNTTVTLTGLRDNTEVRVYSQAVPPVELAGIENATAGTADARTFAFSIAAATVVDVRILHGASAAADGNHYQNTNIESYTIPASNASIPIQQQIDRNYNNP